MPDNLDIPSVLRSGNVGKGSLCVDLSYSAAGRSLGTEHRVRRVPAVDPEVSPSVLKVLVSLYCQEVKTDTSIPLVKLSVECNLQRWMQKKTLVLAVAAQERSWIALKLITVVKSMVLFQYT